MSLVVEFLTSIRGFVIAQNGDELRKWLLVENDVPDHYFRLKRELKASFPDNGSNALEKLVDKCLPEEDDVADGKGSPWPGFNALMKVYLEYWRDVDFDNLVALHASLSDLLMHVPSSLTTPHILLTRPQDPAPMLSPTPHMAPCCCRPACRSQSRCQSWLWG